MAKSTSIQKESEETIRKQIISKQMISTYEEVYNDGWINAIKACERLSKIKNITFPHYRKGLLALKKIPFESKVNN